MLDVRVRPLDLPSSLRIDGLGYQSAVIGLPVWGAAFLVVYAGQAVRCLRIGVDGGVTVVPGVRGPLRDAEPEGDKHLWLLATHGLHLVELATNTVTVTIRDGLPTYSARLTRLDDERLLVSKTLSSTAVVVSIRDARVVQRIRMPTVDHVVQRDGLTLCSFERGVARPVDRSLRRTGPDRAIPTGHGLPLDTGIAVALADLVPALPGSDVTVPRSRAVVALLDDELQPQRERPVGGLERLDGQTSDSTLVGVARDSIVLLAPDTLEELGRSPAIGLNPSAGAIGDRQVATLANGRSLVPSVCLVSW